MTMAQEVIAAAERRWGKLSVQSSFPPKLMESGTFSSGQNDRSMNSQQDTKAASILVIDDELGIRESLRMILMDKYTVHLAPTTEKAIQYLEENHISMIFLDIKMPGVNGLDFLKVIKSRYPLMPVIIITAFPSSQTAITALRNGAFDYIVKPFQFSEILGTTERAIIQSTTISEKDTSIVYSLRRAVYKNFFSTTEALLLAIDAKDSYTAGHSKRVSSLIALVAENLGMNDAQTEALRYAAFLHDIGKIGISDQILMKPGRLTEEEFQSMKLHSEIGYTILEPIDFLKDSLPIVRHHHEWYNGNGYPDRLKGLDIPYEASVLSLIDVYDALTTDRHYRKKYSHKDALQIMEKGIHTQFTPFLTEKIIKIIDDYHRNTCKEF